MPLTATAITLDARAQLAPQHITVFIRNMFEEERLGKPDPVALRVTRHHGKRAFLAGSSDVLDTIQSRAL